MQWRLASSSRPSGPARSGRFRDRLINVYDHPTPLDRTGTLPECLRSLEKVTGLDRVVVIVAATDPAIEHEAEDRSATSSTTSRASTRWSSGTAELGSLHRRLEQLEFADMIAGVSLTGYGAVRNLGLIVAAVLGCESLVFLDDDEVVNDADFLDTALEGLGQRIAEGTRSWRRPATTSTSTAATRWTRTRHWADMFWRQCRPRTTRRSPSSSARRGCAEHPRLRRLHGAALRTCTRTSRSTRGSCAARTWTTSSTRACTASDVFLDGEWHVLHRPPDVADEQIALRQDVYRFIYEHRKLEFAKSQVDLRQVTAESLRPYPGEFIGGSIGGARRGHGAAARCRRAGARRT